MRRHDSGWRDVQLKGWHDRHGLVFPVAGMSLPMVEYDRGVPIAVISYLHRAQPFPQGPDVGAAYQAVGQLYRETGEQLPFFTVRYDVRNWAFSVFGHNESARVFLDATGWVAMTESAFVRNLYRLRGRFMPELSPYGVTFATSPWIKSEPSPDMVEAWPGADLSKRRRNYEPVDRVRSTWLNPCTDIDLAMVDEDRRVSLIVDYKAPQANFDLKSMNMKSMSHLYTTSRSYRTAVPAMVVRYDLHGDEPVFQVHCLNHTARHELAFVLGQHDDVQPLAKAVAGVEWTDLTETLWLAVLRNALRC